MHRILSIFVLLITVTAFSAPGVRATEDAPDTDAAAEFIQTLADETLTVLQQSDVPPTERRQQFSDLLEKGVNTDYMSRFVLGRHWRQATEDQRREFENLFKQYLLANLTNRLADSEYENQSFTVKNAVAAGRRDVIVRSEIRRVDGPALPVEWRVRQFDKGWQIIDLTAEGVSLAITQREEYGSVVQRKGVDGLLAALREQVDSLKNGKTESTPAAQS